MPAYHGRSTANTNPPVVATTICTAQEPNASTSVFRKYRPTSTSVQALLRLFHAVPCGKSEIGLLSVSAVGVTADLASHRIGPRPRTSSPTRRSSCNEPTPHLTRRAFHSVAEMKPPPRLVGPGASSPPDHSVLHERVRRQ